MLMTNNSNNQLEAFNTEQSKAIEVLRLNRPDEVDFKLAKQIGLINDQTRNKINALLPGHNIIFRSNLEKNGYNSVSFLNAFESVYGKFLFESSTEIEPSTKKIFDKVLRYEIDDEIGLENRSELMAAMRRLQSLEASNRGNEVINTKINDLENKINQFNLEKTEAQEKQSKLKGIQDDVNNINKTEDIKKLLKILEEEESEKKKNETALEALEDEKKERKKKLDGINLLETRKKIASF